MTADELYCKMMNNLRKIRERRGLNVTQFCELTGQDKSYWSHVEDGSSKVSLYKLMEVCERASINPEELLDVGMKDDSTEVRRYQDKIVDLLNGCTQKQLELIAHFAEEITKTV